MERKSNDGGIPMLLRGFGVISMAVGAILCLLTGAFDSYHWMWQLPLFSLGMLVLLLVGAFLYLLLLCHRVDPDKEQEYDDRHYRKVLELYVESALPVLRVNVRTKGMNKVPTDRRFLLVCNHCNNIDPVLLLDKFAGHQVAFISKKENKDMFLVGKVMHKLLCQLIDRENDREALKTILKCVEILKEDKASIGVFPEGYILPHRKLHAFRPGVFKIAQKAKVPIVVCTLKDTANAIVNLLHYRPSDIELSVLQVIEPEEYAGKKTVQIADEIYRMMAQDLGPDRVAEFPEPL
jgi:1-acyl-sn-glycerol-3-phosphate acyltransferase